MQNKNIFFKIIFLTLSFLILGGCDGSTPNIPKKHKILKKEKPSWIDSVLPNDTEKYMYGMGIGSDRQQAIKIALADMVAKLGTTIESSYESNEIILNNSYSDSTIKSQIKSQVSKIKVNNYKVIKSYKVSYREFAVMLQTDKVKFLNGLKSSLKQHKEEILDRFSALKGSDILTRYNTKKELEKRAKELIPQILIISQLDATFDKDKNLKFVSKQRKEFIKEQKNLKFYVTGNKKSSKFIKKIKNYLAQHRYKVTNSKNSTIKIVLNIKDYSRGGIAVLTLDVKILDKNSHIGGKTIVMKERDNGSKQSIYKNASIHFEQDINSKGLDEFIGLNIKED